MFDEHTCSINSRLRCVDGGSTQSVGKPPGHKNHSS
jgi:hypothetical protein